MQRLLNFNEHLKVSSAVGILLTSRYYLTGWDDTRAPKFAGKWVIIRDALNLYAEK
jgi:hypothetical protein